jgi:predicted RNase H-like nuclease (RuvC/YqgF family)
LFIIFTHLSKRQDSAEDIESIHTHSLIPDNKVKNESSSEAWNDSVQQLWVHNQKLKQLVINKREESKMANEALRVLQKKWIKAKEEIKQSRAEVKRLQKLLREVENEDNAIRRHVSSTKGIILDQKDTSIEGTPGKSIVIDEESMSSTISITFLN